MVLKGFDVSICFQIHKKLRTKALVLELLAAICLVKGGHDIILTAFDNFKREMNETRRFETLMDYFVNPESFQVKTLKSTDNIQYETCREIVV